MTQLVTLTRAAEELAVSRDTLRRLAAAGELRTVRLARRVLIPVSEIDRIIEGGIGKYAGEKAAKNGEDGAETESTASRKMKRSEGAARG